MNKAAKALSVKVFLQAHIFRKTKLHGGAKLLHFQIEFHSNFRFASTLLLRCLPQQTDGKYSYYAKYIKGCWSSRMICVKHYTLIGQLVTPVSQNT